MSKKKAQSKNGQEKPRQGKTDDVRSPQKKTVIITTKQPKTDGENVKEKAEAELAKATATFQLSSLVRHGRKTEDVAASYEKKPFEFFQSIKWDEHWKEFVSMGENGKFKYATAHDFSKKVGKTEQERKWLYCAVGPYIEREKKLLPHVGDWTAIRSSFFIGETDKETLLFGSPKTKALREIMSQHLDVLKFAQGMADILIDWLARWQKYADQIDKYFDYSVAIPGQTPLETEQRFDLYLKMQSKLFVHTTDSVRQILKCMGVGESDVSLLTHIMVASMKGALGDDKAQMVLASMQKNSNGNGRLILEGQQASSTQEATEDEKTMSQVSDSFKNNPALQLMLGTFIQKAQMFSMPHPDLKIAGVPDEEDDSTEPPVHSHAQGKANAAKKSPVH